MSDRNISDATDNRGSSINGGAIWTALVIAAVVAFVFQNTEDTTIQFLFFDFSLPIWILVVASLVVGASLGWIWRRGRRKNARA